MKANKFITVIFVLVVVFGVYMLISELRKKKTHSRPSAASQSAPVSQKESTGMANKCVSERIDSNRKTGTRTAWERDPFLYPKGYAKKSEGGPFPWRLTSVMISGGERIAILDQAPYVVSVGDWLGSSRITEIEPDRIVLKGEDETRELVLEGSK